MSGKGSARNVVDLRDSDDDDDGNDDVLVVANRSKSKAKSSRKRKRSSKTTQSQVNEWASGPRGKWARVGRQRVPVESAVDYASGYERLGLGNYGYEGESVYRNGGDDEEDRDLKKAIALSKASADSEIIKEQDAALQASIEMDRLKAKEKAEVEERLKQQAAEEEERKRQLDPEVVAKRQEGVRKKLLEKLPDEDESSEAVRIRLSVPNGKTLRRFHKNDTLSDLFVWTKAYDTRCIECKVHEIIIPPNQRYRSDAGRAILKTKLGTLSLDMVCIRVVVVEE
uniref:UBX domain-containing protein n=1 Tax=Mucochytrium quahogii TaxID=96639 RepID=A0A7S2WDK0_9STRA|mmetsp:Transcript_19065/g.31222  ORF Transcript_19065/g.31222 Transcript_19065/m.31222 type:complete len:283 (+) Transcript_19065:95-943(+)